MARFDGHYDFLLAVSGLYSNVCILPYYHYHSLHGRSKPQALLSPLFMAALWNGAGHYIFAL